MSTNGLAAFLADANEFRTIPIVRKFLADVIEPLGVFSNLRDEAVFLLESKDDESPWARYSFIGVAPFLTLESETGETFSVKDENGNEQVVMPTLKEAFQWAEQALDVRPLREVVPFTGGAVGFLGYDFISAIEKVPRHENCDLGMKASYFVFCESLFAFDHQKRELLLIHYIRLHGGETEQEKIEKYRSAQQRIAALAAKAVRIQAERPLLPADEEAGRAVSFAQAMSNYEKERFLQDVETVKQYIAAGDVFQAVLSQRFCVPVRAGGLAVYRLLRHINPSPYMFYFRLSDTEIVGSSPEKLIQVRNRRIEIDPIAGTRRRGRSPEEDAMLADELYNDPKERAEHYMLVDLARNDIGRVAEYGTVRVSELFTVERYSHVMHLVSEVEGVLNADRTIYDAIAAVFPGGTITGAPKVRTMEIIEELEPVTRGPYTGAMGWIDYAGNMELNIIIRTLVTKDGVGYLQTGAGIVIDSDPYREYRECLNKARAVALAVQQS